MTEIGEWFRASGVLPHGYCYQWKGSLVWLHATSDALIAVAYFSIPVALVRFVRKRRDIPFSWMFVSFAVFIAACGATHVMDIWTLWVPSYWFSGAVKVVTALASVPTAIFLVRLMPQALSLPSPSAMQAAFEELRKQDASLKESEERFRQMAENIQEIFWMIEPHSKGVRYVSPAFEQICERPMESLRTNPTSYRELIHVEDRERVLTALEGLEANGHFDEEFRIVCPSGTVKWVKAIGFTARDEGGRVKSLVGTAQEITARKEMENVLRESEDRYRDLVEHSTDLICTHTLDGRILSVNELPIRLLGYSREELLNKPMRTFLVPEARKEFDAALERIRKEGVIQGLMIVMTKDGERRIWEYRNTLRVDGGRGPIVRGIAHDVTEQKRMERALRLSEEKFSKAFRASPQGLVISALDAGTVIEANDSFLRIMGLTREEVVNHGFFGLGFWSCSSDRQTAQKEIERDGRIESRQINVQTKLGKKRVVNYSGELIHLGKRNCLLSVCEDITERKQAEARLREYEKAVEGVEEMIAVVDRNYRYLLANQAFVSFRGLTKEQVVGRLVSEVMDPEFFETAVKEKMTECFDGKIVRYETKYRYPGLGERDVQVTYFPIDAPGGVDRVVCVLQDVTERNKAEAELRRLSGRLLQLQDEERRKIARDLHDSTGQDLVALAATLNQVHDALPASNRKLRKMAARCRGVAERSLREVRTLSYLLHPPMLDEAGLVDAVMHFADGFEERTGIDVDLDVSPEFGRLPQEMELGLFRVIQESLVNIQRHSGSYTANICLKREPDGVNLRVSDTGRGISATGRTTDGIPATIGVGIPSMEERVKQVGGRLEIDSNKGGTSVFVTVPIHA